MFFTVPKKKKRSLHGSSSDSSSSEESSEEEDGDDAKYATLVTFGDKKYSSPFLEYQEQRAADQDAV